MKVVILIILGIQTIKCESPEIDDKVIAAKFNKKCQSIVCPPIEDPHCLRLTHKITNYTLNIITVNKCEIKYAECQGDYNAKFVPMKNCRGNHKKIGKMPKTLEQQPETQENKKETQENKPETQENQPMPVSFPAPPATPFLMSQSSPVVTTFEAEQISHPVNVVAAIRKKRQADDSAKECPDKCPVSNVMVCAKGINGIYKTFLSPCHMKMYTCQTGEEIELISRHPCTFTAPTVIDSKKTSLSLKQQSSEDDTILRFIRCRDKHYVAANEDLPESFKNDPDCQFKDKHDQSHLKINTDEVKDVTQENQNEQLNGKCKIKKISFSKAKKLNGRVELGPDIHGVPGVHIDLGTDQKQIAKLKGTLEVKNYDSKKPTVKLLFETKNTGAGALPISKIKLKCPENKIKGGQKVDITQDEEGKLKTLRVTVGDEHKNETARRQDDQELNNEPRIAIDFGPDAEKYKGISQAIRFLPNDDGITNTLTIDVGNETPLDATDTQELFCDVSNLHERFGPFDPVFHISQRHDRSLRGVQVSVVSQKEVVTTLKEKGFVEKLFDLEPAIPGQDKNGKDGGKDGGHAKLHLAQDKDTLQLIEKKDIKNKLQLDVSKGNKVKLQLTEHAKQYMEKHAKVIRSTNDSIVGMTIKAGNVNKPNEKPLRLNFIFDTYQISQYNLGWSWKTIEAPFTDHMHRQGAHELTPLFLPEVNEEQVLQNVKLVFPFVNQTKTMSKLSLDVADPGKVVFKLL